MLCCASAAPSSSTSITFTMTKPKIFIIFYSAYGHTKTMAEKIKAGVDAAGGEGLLYQVAETLPADVVEKMHAPPKPWPEVPVITAAELPHADGLIFGTPTRFGTPSAQFKAFLDSTGGLWQSGALVGKPIAAFTGTASINGGQETTLMTLLPFIVHHGAFFIPLGYTTPLLFKLDEVRGGSAYGASFLAGPDGSRAVSETELAIAEHQGKYFTGVVKTLVAGKAAVAAAAPST